MKEFLVMANANEIEDEPPRVDDDVDEDSQGTECADFEDDEEGLEDEHWALSGDEIAELEANLLPVCLMVTKVWSDDSKKKN